MYAKRPSFKGAADLDFSGFFSLLNTKTKYIYEARRENIIREIRVHYTYRVFRSEYEIYIRVTRRVSTGTRTATYAYYYVCTRAHVDADILLLVRVRFKPYVIVLVNTVSIANDNYERKTIGNNAGILYAGKRRFEIHFDRTFIYRN